MRICIYVIVFIGTLCCGSLQAQDSLRVLAVGNSYSVDGVMHLDKILRATAPSLNQCSVYVLSQASASLKYWKGELESGAQHTPLWMAGYHDMKIGEKSLREIFQCPWDIIVFQQYSGDAPNYSTYQPYLHQLVVAAREENPNPNLKIAWQMVWSYSSNSGFYPAGEERWRLIRNATKELQSSGDVDIVIPTGTAIENARHTILQDMGDLTRDDTHLSYGVGRYIAACTWYEVLFAPFYGTTMLGCNAVYSPRAQEVETSKYPCAAVDEKNKNICQRCAYEAVKNVFELNGTIVSEPSMYETLKNQMDENSLPVLDIRVDLDEVNEVDYTDAEIELKESGYDSEELHSVMTFKSQLKYRGGTSLGYKKKSFTFRPLDNQNERKDLDILGIREDDNWILDAMAIDRIRMRNRICFDLWNDFSKLPYSTNYDGRNGTKGRFVEVFVNGSYHGLYCLTDKINRKLLGLKKVADAENGDTIVRGLLYKGKKWGSASDLLSYNNVSVNSSVWNAWEIKYPNENFSYETWQPLMDLIDFCSDAVDDDEFGRSVFDRFYENNLIDYLIMTFALNVGDNLYKNTFLSMRDVTSDSHFVITPWDMDMSLGGYWDGKRDESLTNIHKYDAKGPFNRLCARNINGFMERLQDRWRESFNTIFSIDNVYGFLDRYAMLFVNSGAWEREYNKWNGIPVPLSANVAEEVDYVKDWYRKNWNSLCLQMDIDMSIRDIWRLSNGGGIYSLDGRKYKDLDVKNLPKGIYIINGRKLIVK